MVESGAQPLDVRAEAPARPWSREDVDGWIKEHHQALLRFVATRVLNVSDAEDVCQEVWLKAWENRAQFDGCRVRAWLFEVARNLMIDESRRASNRFHRWMLSIFVSPDGHDDGLRIVDQLASDEGDLDDEVLQRLRQCLDKLGTDKLAVVEGWLSGQKYESFAPRLGLTSEQAHRRFHTAKTNLRKCLGDLL